jgi:hypothetical protein
MPATNVAAALRRIGSVHIRVGVMHCHPHVLGIMYTTHHRKHPLHATSNITLVG